MVRRGQRTLLALRHQFFLHRHHLVAQRDQIDVDLPALGEQCLPLHFLFMDVVLDLFRQHLDLGVIKFGVRRSGFDVVDQYLRTVMLDIGFVQRVILDLAAKGRVKSLPRSWWIFSSIRFALIFCLDAPPRAFSNCSK